MKTSPDWEFVTHCIATGAVLPAQVFRPPVCAVRVFEFEQLWSRRFFNILRGLAKATDSGNFSLLVLEPDPEDYFRRHFNSLPLVSFAAEDTADSYIHEINRDPGGSPADAIVHNSNRIVICPDKNTWCAYACRDFGVGMICARDRASVDALTALHMAPMRDAILEGIVSFPPGVDPERTATMLLTNYGDDAKYRKPEGH